MSLRPLMRVLIVEDEPPARERLRRLLERIGGTEVVGEAENGRIALEMAEELQPDVVLLDVNMPEVDGLRMLEAMDDPPSVIFTTAYEHHAVRAFELEAVDYLLKPFSAERLGRALDRVRKQLAVERTDAMRQPPARLPVDTGTRTDLIAPDRVVVARIEEGVVFLFLDDGDKVCYSGTLQELEDSLPENAFLRASRQSIVRLAAIESFVTTAEGGLILHLTRKLREAVSRRRARFFRAHLR